MVALIYLVHSLQPLLTLAAEMEIVFPQQCSAALPKTGCLNNSAFE